MTNSNERARGGIELSADSPLTTEDVRALLTGMEARTDSALEFYVKARDGKMLRGARGLSRAHWRCEKGCLLLDVFQLPDLALGTYKPAFRLSPERNAKTSATARQNRTSDGERRWQESADVVMPDDLEYWLNCDHVVDYPVSAKQARQAGEKRAGKIIAATR